MLGNVQFLSLTKPDGTRSGRGGLENERPDFPPAWAWSVPARPGRNFLRYLTETPSDLAMGGVARSRGAGYSADLEELAGRHVTGGKPLGFGELARDVGDQGQSRNIGSPPDFIIARGDARPT